MPYESHSRGVSDLKAHLVLTTKDGREVISATMLARLTEIVESVCEKWGCQVLEFNGEVDHMHLLFSYYPQVQLSKFVNNLKTVTSRMIRKEFAAEVARFYQNKPEFWTKSYFLASSGGVTVETWKRYVQNQNPPTGSKKRLSNKGVSNPRV